MTQRRRVTLAGHLSWVPACYVGAIAAGALWAVLLHRAQHPATRDASMVGIFPASAMVTAGIVCAVLAVAGIAVVTLTRARTLGAAIVIAALVGPVVAAATRYILAEAFLLVALFVTHRLRRRRTTPVEVCTTAVRPVGALCGLLVGVQAAYLLWLYLALYAPLVLAAPAFALTLPIRTRGFANGLLAAAAGSTTLLATYYALLSVS